VRQRTEEALRESEERLQHLVVSSPSVVCSLRPQGEAIEISFVSENAQDILGYKPEEVCDFQLWQTILHPEDIPSLMAQIPVMSEMQTASTLEYRVRHRDGSYRWLHDTNRPILDEDDQLVEVIGSWIDITERKRMEKQIRASLREKEVLLKEIHHRVKNNLLVISSLLDLQTDTVQDPQALQAFQDSRDRIGSMALIHEKLYQSPNLGNISASEYLEDLAHDLLGTYGAWTGDITLTLQIDDVSLDIDTAVPCGLILNELVSNALKHAFPPGGESAPRGAPSGGGELCIILRGEGDRLTLTVSDNGVGLPPDLDYRNTETLGLQLVNMLTQQLRGSMELDRSKGTAFKIAWGRGNRNP